MASAQRQRDLALIEHLSRSPRAFGFFQAVQLIQRAASDAAPVGELGPPQREAIRFTHDLDLIFHTSDIVDIKRSIRGGIPFTEITTTFLGLYGTTSPLATYFTEEVMRAEAADEKSLKAFYDLFHHRAISLFYRAWKKYRFAIGFHGDASDVFTRRALSFVGVDAAGAMPTRGLPAFGLLALAPLLSQRTRPARTLEIILERLFPGTPVEIESFIARRVLLTDDQCAKLGVQNGMLGTDFTIGRTALDRSGRFRVALGPLGYDMFESLMPGGKKHSLLRQVIDQFTRGVLEIEVELRLSDDEAPRFQLGAARGSLLATTTTLRAKRGKPMIARFVLSETPGEVRPTILND